MKLALYSIENGYALKKKYFKALNKVRIPYHKEDVAIGEVKENNVTFIDVNSVEELFTLSKEIGHELMIDRLFDALYYTPGIVIYDDYME